MSAKTIDSKRRELMTAVETAELLGVEVQTLSNWRSSGRHKLPFTRVGSAIRYRRQAVEKWLEDRTVAAGR